jgi:arginine decarboxylase
MTCVSDASRSRAAAEHGIASLIRANAPGNGPNPHLTGVGIPSIGGHTERPPLPSTGHSRGGKPPGGLTIRVSAGSGTGRTPLSAFDAALRDAGVADFNLVRLSSIIPPGSTVVDVHGRHQLTGGHGDLLYCVYAAAYAYAPGESAWAGVGWSLERNGTGAGLFVEHDARTRADLEWALAASLEELSNRRGRAFAPAGSVLTGATCTGAPACAVVIASYRREGWGY